MAALPARGGAVPWCVRTKGPAMANACVDAQKREEKGGKERKRGKEEKKKGERGSGAVE